MEGARAPAVLGMHAVVPTLFAGVPALSVRELA
jgi:hypothetical protein